MPGDYDIPKPSRIRLKETKPEIAHRLYRKEQRRAQKEARRISRANGGYCVTPPRDDGDGGETISPPRNPIVIDDNDELDEDQVGMNYQRRSSALGGRTAEEWADRMAWMEAEELGRFFPALPEVDVHIPQRYRSVNNNHYLDMPFVFSSSTHFQTHFFPHAQAHAQLHAATAHAALAAHSNIHQHLHNLHKYLHGHHRRHRGRDAVEEVRFNGGPIPALGNMDEATYATWVREGMERLRQRNEAASFEARRRERLETERAEYAARESRKREMETQREAERKARAEREARQREERAARADEKKKLIRSRWRARCAALSDNEIIAIEMGWEDVPWPVYEVPNVKDGAEAINEEMVGDFLRSIAKDDVAGAGAGTGGVGDLNLATKKVMRETIKVFHPDRFFSRVLPRVKEDARDAVRQGVERISRIINNLAARQSASA